MKFLFLLFFIALIQSASALTILIDPGHGGEDDGAKAETVGRTPPELIKEKDIAMSIAKRIYDKLLDKNYTAFLTRSFDRTVSLPERAAIAEKTKADLFISIHINSSPTGPASGFETYYLGNADDWAIKKVEKAENVQTKGDEFVVQQILVDLVIDQTVSTSKPLAQNIHSEIKSSVGRKYGIHSRGIKPGMFYVLALSKRPGVLLEVGFISTQKERVRMMNPQFQEDYANAVVKGIESFIKSQTQKTHPSVRAKKKRRR